MATALFINLGAVIAMMLLLWLLAVAIRDVSFIDVVWAYGMVAVTLFTAMLRPGGMAGPMGWALLLLVTAWGLRLGTHLLRRWRRLGPDPRYDRIIAAAKARRGWGFVVTALVQVFLLQAPLLWIVSMPAQAGIIADTGRPIGGLAALGIALAVIGIGFETIGDRQLERFRQDPASHGRVLDTGLWRYTRHPNYFGDACTWWGIWLVAMAAGAGLWTGLGPLFLTFTLIRWSGAALLEKGLKKTRPDYVAYVARTSGFLPWPPKRG